MHQQTNHHWFRYWLVAWMAPSHYLNNAGILLSWPLGTNFSEISIKIQTFSFKMSFQNVVWKMAPILSWPQCVKSFHTYFWNASLVPPWILNKVKAYPVPSIHIFFHTKYVIHILKDMIHIYHIKISRASIHIFEMHPWCLFAFWIQLWYIWSYL